MHAPLSLYDAFATVPDPRSAHGKRHPLQALLTLTVVSMLSGARTLQAIAQFGRDRAQVLAHTLGFTRTDLPCAATLHYLFAELDHAAFDQALRTWLRGHDAVAEHVLSLDGKTLRGTARAHLPGLHVLTAYAHQSHTVLAQVPVAAKTNEHKTALDLLAELPIKDQLTLGDALFCQRDISKAIVQEGGDYLWVVKENQPELHATLALAFEEPDFSPVGTGSGGARA